MVARGGRSMPVVRGFSGDGPTKRPTIASSRLRWAARPVPHHPTARSAPSPSLQGRRELVSARRAEAMGAVSRWSMPVVRGFPGDGPAERPAIGGGSRLGGASRLVPHDPTARSASVLSLFREEGSLFPRGGRRRWGRGAVGRCPWFVVFWRTDPLKGPNRGFGGLRGGQADASPPHRSLRSGRPLLGEEGSFCPVGGRRQLDGGRGGGKCVRFVAF